MLQYFENLRRQPEAVRRKAAFRISLYSTLGIAVVWIIATSLIYYASTESVSGTKTAGRRDVPTLSQTFGGLVDRVSDIFTTSFVAPIASTTEAFEAFKETVQHEMQEVEIGTTSESQEI
ncbi:MAG TPA: hypothetical protein VGE35_04435 [Candidatus Paceibacterota bacterium]